MPSKSEAQRRFMAAAAHDPKFAREAGIPLSVAREFNEADRAKEDGRRKVAKAMLERRR